MKIGSLLFLFVIFSSCSDNDDEITNSCGITNPLVELEWLRTEIDKRKEEVTEDSKYCYILQAIHKGKTIFLYQDCNPFINKVIPILDCEGNSLGFLGGDILSIDITNSTIIYKPSDFACQLE